MEGNIFDQGRSGKHLINRTLLASSTLCMCVQASMCLCVT